MKISRKIQIALVFMLSLMTFNSVYAVGGFNEWRFKTGWVLARGLVLDDNGNPSYVAYDEKGDIVIDSIDTGGNDVNKLFVLSGDEYRIYAKFYKDFIEQYADGIARGATVISGDAYKAMPFSTIDGKAITDSSKGELLAGMVSVLIRAKDQIFIPDTDPSLLQARINLNAIDDSIVSDDSIKSVLLDPEGNVLEKTEYNIGFKVQFTDNEDDGYTIEHGDEKYDPLHLAILQGSMAYLGGTAVTDKEGQYTSMYMLPPCPGFTFNYTSPLTLELFYKQFHPRAKNRLGLYYLMKQGYDFCSGLSARAPGPGLGGLMAQVAAIGIESSISVPIPQLSFFVDTAVIAGTGYFSNTKTQGKEGEPLPLGDTKYSYEAPDHNFETMADYKFDFDGDDKNDVAVLGSTYEKTNDDGDTVVVFEKEREPKDLQGIYLSSGSQDPDSEDENKNQPDFIRLADKLPDLKDQGLLESISEEDFKETDILIFRESNGLLITKRKGLEDSAVRRESGTVSGVDTETGEMHYSVMVRGPRSAGSDFASYVNRGTSTWYSDWQSKAKMDPSLHERVADHIRPQEKIRIIAINRRTGYMGSVRTTYGKFAGDSIISMHIDKIIMRPPNLKIIAEREYEVEKGLTSGQGEDSERQYLIGYEGAALASDKVIKVTTEWLDHDGSALPEELSDYGFTGRLAKIVSENTLGEEADSGALANFKIKPGRHMEQIQIGSDSKKNEHYYVQVSPECMDECDAVSFETGDAEGPLKYRPKNYVPVLTPISDEAQTLEQYRAYKKYKRENPDTEIEKPEPIYKWFYRPELQFSLYSLEMKNIFRANDNDAQQIDIYQDETPVITSSDDLIKILYNLLEQTIKPLEFLGAGQELVFALGEEEVKVVDFGEGQQLKFENLEHLGSLDVEDFLSLRLYANNDPGNILWEYAFAQLLIFPVTEIDEPEILLSADDASDITFTATILAELEGPETVSWGAESDETVTFNPPSESNAKGLYKTLAQLPTKVDTLVDVYALDSSGSKINASRYKIVPGKPETITVEQSGKVAIDEIGEITLTITAKDAFNNMVADGTSINVYSTDLLIEGEPSIVDGTATLTVKSGFTPGAQDLFIEVGSLSETVSINVHDIDLTVQTAQEVELGERLPIAITASSTYGDLSGVPIKVKATRASLNQHVYTLNALNSINIVAYVGDFVGEGNVSAAIANKYQRSDFKVVDTSGVQVLDNVLVAGVSGTGSFSAGGATFQYTGSTAVVVNGQQGEEFRASLADYLEPPMLPELKFSMQEEIVQNQLIDDMLDVPGNMQNTVRISSSFEQFNYAYQFDSTSQMKIEHLELKDITSPGIVLNYKIDALGGSQKIANFENLGLTLSLNDSQQLSLSQTDGATTVTVVSQTLAADAWYKVGAHIVNGELVLQVNSEINKSTEALPIVSNTSQYLVIGNGFSGEISNLSVYDWDAEKIITFEDGSLEQTVTLDSSGKGLFRTTARNFNAFASLNQRKFNRLKEKYGNAYFQIAYAAGNDCSPIDTSAVDSFGEFIDQAAAMRGHMADCEYLPKMKKAFMTIKSDAGVWRKSIAIVDFTAYSALYINAKVTQMALILGPQCAEGAITGNVENFASAACDIITSFFLVGDIRDFAIHSWHFHFGDENKFNYPVYVFSGLGMAASFASIAGVGVPANVGLAGAKTAAKLMTGPFPTALAKYLSKEVGDNYGNIGRLATVLRRTLPLLQVTAAVIVMKDEVPKVYDAIKGIKAEQIIGIMNYFKIALEQLEQEFTVAHLDSNQSKLFLVAYAAIDANSILRMLGGSDNAASALKKLLKNMQDSQARLQDINIRNGLNDLFTDGIAKLGKYADDIENPQIRKIIADDKFLSSLIIVQNIAGDKNAQKVIDSIRMIPCVPKGCTMGGVSAGADGLKQFFGLFDNLINAKRAGKISPDAWKSLEKVINTMGPKRGTNSRDGAINRYRTSKGSTANLAEIALQVTQRNGAKLLEAEGELITLAGKYEPDHIIRIGDKTIYREVKDWKADVVEKSLTSSLKGGSEAGQLHKTLVHLLKDGIPANPKNLDFEWVFTSGNASQIASNLHKKMKNNSARLKEIMIKTGNSELIDIATKSSRKSDFNSFVDGKFKQLLETLIVDSKII